MNIYYFYNWGGKESQYMWLLVLGGGKSEVAVRGYLVLVLPQPVSSFIKEGWQRLSCLSPRTTGCVKGPQVYVDCYSKAAAQVPYFRTHASIPFQRSGGMWTRACSAVGQCLLTPPRQATDAGSGVSLQPWSFWSKGFLVLVWNLYWATFPLTVQFQATSLLKKFFKLVLLK